MRVPSGWGYDFSIARASIMGSVAKRLSVTSIHDSRQGAKQIAAPETVACFGVLYQAAATSAVRGFLPRLSIGDWRSVLSSEVLIRQDIEFLWQAVGHLCEVRKFSSQFRCKLPGSKTPLPVSLVHARRVHAGFTAHAQHILQRDQGKLG